MTALWRCDTCGVLTHVNPPRELVYEEVETEVEVPVTEKKDVKNEKTGVVETVEIHTGKTKRIKAKQRVPATVKKKQQDPYTGKHILVDVPKYKFLAPRAIIVTLQAGDDYIKRDFCESCYKLYQDKVQSLWNTLESIEPK